MKNTSYKYFIAIALAGGLSSCRKNLLDSVPNDRVSSNIFWKTENDALLADNALYTDLDGTSIFTWDALSDIAHTNQNFDTQAFIELGTYDIANAKIYNEWSAAYTGIQATNYFLENIDKVPSINTTLINRFKGEAKVLRAYQYIKLAGFFGDVPLITKTLTIAEGQQVSRTPISQVWDFVDKELSDAAALLPASYAAADKGRITSGAAWALKARADLWAGRYQLAADAATQVKGYTLYSSYQNLFKYAAENNSEVILDKQFLKDSYSNGVFALLAPYSQKNAQSYYVPTKALVDAYETSGGKISMMQAVVLIPTIHMITVTRAFVFLFMLMGIYCQAELPLNRPQIVVQQMPSEVPTLRQQPVITSKNISMRRITPIHQTAVLTSSYCVMLKFC